LAEGKIDMSMKQTPCSGPEQRNGAKPEQTDTAKALQASEIRYRRLFEFVQDGILILEAETGIVVDVNPFLVNLSGYSREAFLTKKVWELGFFKDAIANEDKFRELQAKDYLHYENLPLETCDGRHIEVEFFSNVYLVNQHRMIQCNIRDINERKRTEEALRKSEKKYRGLVEGLNDAVYRMTLPEGRYEYFSSSVENVFGYPREEFINNPLFIKKILHPDSAGYLEEKWKGLLEGKVPETYEYKIIDSEGNERWIVQSNKATFDDSGKIKTIEGLCRNITEYKEAEKSLIESEALFRGMFKNHSAVMLCIDHNTGQIVEANQAAAQYYGYPLEKMMQMKIQQFNTLSPAEIAEKMGDALNEQTNIFEFKHSLADGRVRDVEVHSTPITVQNQTLLFSIIHDITERRRAEEALRESEERYRIIADFTYDWEYWLAPDGSFVYVSPSCEKVTGYSAEEFMQDSGLMERIIHSEDYGKLTCFHVKQRKPMNDAHSESDFRIDTRTGEIRWISLCSQPVFSKDGRFLGWRGSNRDITERKRVETYREIGREILQILNEPGDLQESIRRVLDVLKTRTGVDAVGLRLQEGEDFPYYAEDGFPPDFLLTENTLLERDKEGSVCRDKEGNVCLECTCGLVLSGKTDSSSPLFTQGGSCWTNDSFPLLDLPSDQDFRLHPRNQCIHQGYASVALIPVRTVDRIVGLIQLNDKRKGRFTLETVEILEGIASHVGSALMRKRVEEEREYLQAQFTQAQKMEAVGRLAGGVAHDFNNMLGIILGHADMILEEMNPDQPYYADLTEIREAGERSADLTRQLLAFARKQTVTPRVTDLNKTVEGMLKMLHRLIGEDIDMAWIPGEKVWSVKIDPVQIDQVLVNLCINARDAIADVGKVTIETGNIVFDEDYCRVHADFVPGEYTLLAVSDNGCGMDSETLSQLFEPFFTTKEMDKGTGLGLATVYGVVKQNNGFINVYSERDQGTTFKIYLPRYRPREIPLPDREALRPAVRGHETILLVEDEPAILRMTTTMLERTGYKVLAAGTPGEAIALAREHAGEIHLLMTDVVMPEMNGRDLARNLLSLYPDLKRLFMSGYTANVIAHHGVLDEGVNFIQKPYSGKDLGAKVREALEG